MKMKILLVLLLIVIMGIAACEKKESIPESDKKETESIEQTESSKVPSESELEGEDIGTVNEEVEEKDEVIYNTQSIYVRDGEWLYYEDRSAIYRVKIDGSYIQKLTSTFDMESRGGTVLVGDWVYTTARGGTGKNFWTGTVKVKKDGSEWSTVCGEQIKLFDEKYGVYSDENGIHKVMLENQQDTIVAYINNVWHVEDIIDEYIYYYSKDESFRRVKFDTNNEEVLIDSGEEVGNIIIADGWIYYSVNKGDSNDNPKEWSGGVYRKRLDGSENELIISRTGGGIYASKVYGNKVYCDGYECVNIEGNSWGTYYYYDEKPYFVVVDMDSKEEKTVGVDDIKKTEIQYQYERYVEKSGESVIETFIGYNNIGLNYIDDECVIFCVIRPGDEEGAYEYYYYISDLNGTNIVELWSEK